MTIQGYDDSFWDTTIPDPRGYAYPRVYTADYDRARREAPQYRFVIHKATGASPKYKHCYTDIAYQRSSYKSLVAGYGARGAYHFYHSCQAPIVQAQYFLNTTCKIENTVYSYMYNIPPIGDYEIYETDRKLAQKNFLSYLSYIWNRTGIRPIIYTGLPYWNWLGNPSWSTEFDLWIAQYNNYSQPVLPRPWKTWRLWQYTDKGTVPGLNGGVDLNRFNGGEDEFRAWTNTNSTGITLPITLTPAFPRLAVVEVYSLRVRNAPDLKASVIGGKTKGNELVVYQEAVIGSNLWIRIGANPQQWVCMKYGNDVFVRYK